MKVLLICPPTPNIIRSNTPSVVEDDAGTFPPLGLLYIAAHAEKIADCEVEIIDCLAEKIGHGDLNKHLIDRSPDIVGIQVMTFTLPDSILVAKAVRKMLPKTLIVFGGPHTSIYPEETAALPDVDAVVVGEGEYVFTELVKERACRAPLLLWTPCSNATVMISLIRSKGRAGFGHLSTHSAQWVQSHIPPASLKS